MRDVTIQELLGSIQLETGMMHTLRVHFPQLRVRLPIDPAEAQHWDDRFILTMDRSGQTTSCVRTVKDDLLPGDAYVDLLYDVLFPDARFTLTVDAGADGTSYTLFADEPYDRLFAA